MQASRHAKETAIVYPMSTAGTLPVTNDEDDYSNEEHAESKGSGLSIGDFADLGEEDCLNDGVVSVGLVVVDGGCHLTIYPLLKVIGLSVGQTFLEVNITFLTQNYCVVVPHFNGL